MEIYKNIAILRIRKNNDGDDNMVMIMIMIEKLQCLNLLSYHF